MPFSKSLFRTLIVLAAVFGLMSASCARRRKYENPISKDTQQPDKVLFDKAIADIERSRYEIARLTLNTLMNTYDTSEYMAKAKLAVADSWYRQGDSHGLAQAEAEYKDFILFYPAMEESAEAQEKVCDIHVRQMEKADRDSKHANRAEDECRLVLTLYPNSKHAPMAAQRLREIQEVLAQKEFGVGSYYYTKNSFPAAAHRLQDVTDQYPLFSMADDALMKLGDSYGKMGPRLADRSAAAYARIVKEYPLSPFVAEAKSKLDQMERPIPEADPVALARMKYEQENRTKRSTLSKTINMFAHNPDVSMAAKSGTPAMETLTPTSPVNVPVIMARAPVTADVSIQTVSDTTALDNNPDARAKKPGEGPGAASGLQKPVISPATAQAGSGSFTLTVNGAEFASNSKVLWNGVPLVTTFVNPGQLTATVPANLITATRIVAVKVVTGGVVASDIADFVVTPPPVPTAAGRKKKS